MSNLAVIKIIRIRILTNFLSLFIILTGCLPLSAHENGDTISLDGIWQLRQQGSSEIVNAVVPGTIFTDLQCNKIIPDPFFSANEEKLQWISDTGWVYEKYFELDHTFFTNRYMKLVCEGLDTYAKVYINDSLVITADNMFKSWYVSLKGILRIGYNKITIEFHSVTKLNKTFYEKLKYKLPGDERVVCRKAAYQFGWDWGPRFVTMGIWRPIYIKYSRYVDMLDVDFIQKSLSDSLARMSASFVINSALADTADFKLTVDSTVFFIGREILKKGINAIRIDFDIINPKRWWPTGFGAPARYNLGYQVWVSGRKEAEGHQKIGLRTVELVQKPDSIGTSFYLKVNGIPVFIRGANYIPMDNFLTRVTDSMYTALIADVAAANMNMLRVWGGGIYETDIFYDLCDEKGIMVWQDFMFANAMCPGEDQFFTSVRDEVTQNIVRLRSHPSIVLWCGNNEIDEGWSNWGWVKDYGYDKQDSSRIYLTYRKIFHELIPNALLLHDTLRPYIATSPLLGWGNEESLKKGNLHYWGVWWGKEPFETYNDKVGRFVSEYGFQGFPDYTTIEKFTMPADRHFGSVAMKAHQKSPVGFETIQEYMEWYYKVPSDFAMYGYVSQLLQADGLKTAIEAHRRVKPACMGTLYWQLNDSWPVISWSSRDYYGKKKASYWAACHAYRDFFVSPVMKGERLNVYATVDEPEDQQAELLVVLADFDGKVLWQEVKKYNFSAKKTEVVTDTNLSSYLNGADKSNLFIYAQIKNILGIRASKLIYFVPPKEMKLEKAPIEITIQKSKDGCDIELYTTKLAKGVFLSTAVAGEFSDNYFDLMPFEQKRIQFVTRDQDIPFDFQDSIHIISLIDACME